MVFSLRYVKHPRLKKHLYPSVNDMERKNTTDAVISLVTYLQELEENNKLNESEYKQALKLVNDVVNSR